MPVKIKKNKNKTVDVEVTCDYCGKPITHTNEYGMFCDNYCGLEESKKAKEFWDEFIKKFLSIMGE